MLQIAYMDPHPVPDTCTESLQMLYTADAMGQLGVCVEFITPEPEYIDSRGEHILGHALSDNVQFHYLTNWRKNWWYPGSSNKPYYYAAMRLLASLNVDAVFCRNLKMADYLLRKGSTIPLYFESHEPFTETYREDHPHMTAREQKKFSELKERESFVYRHSSGLVVVPPLLEAFVRSEYGLQKKIAVAPNGVDLEQAFIHDKAMEANKERPVVLYLGSLHAWKGVETLIHSMVEVAPEAMLRVAGGAEARIQELKRLAVSCSVAERVEFVGQVEPGRRFEVIQIADVCVLPLTNAGIASRYTSPIKLFEYMASGKAIVVSDLPSTRVFVTDEKEVLMAKVGDASSLAMTINRLLASRALRNELGDRARRCVEQYSWKKRAETIVSYIEQDLVEMKGGR